MSDRKPRLAVPAGAVDTAIHVYRASVPAVPGGPPVPGDFPASAYQSVQRRLGFSRVVVVQPNAYQDDNRVTVESVKALGPGAKGVGVVKPGVSDAEIERLSKAGIVGQRIFQMQWGAVGFDRMHEVMARALVRHAPERMLWASNWPHPSAPKDRMPDDADLLDLLLDWAPDEAVRRKILVDNPTEFYAFR